MNNTLKSLALLLIFSFTALAQAMTCLEVLHPQGIDFLDKYETTLEEFKALSQARPYHEYLEFSMNRQIEATLDYMFAQIDVPYADPGGVSDGINRLRRDLVEMRRAVKLDYDAFINLSYRFSAAVNLQRLPLSAEPEERNALVRNLWPYSNGLVERLELNPHDYLLLPSEETLDLAAINFLRAHDIAVLELSLQPFTAYARDLDLALHQTHAEAPLLNPSERTTFYKNFAHFCAEHPSEAHLLQGLWYLVFTELGYPLHPSALKHFVNSFHGEGLQNALNESPRLMMEFPNRVSHAELGLALSELHAFTSGI